jgi:CheY-like chemotaxis protein
MAANILVVDDNPLSRKLMTDMLSADGHHVRCAASGAEALTLIAAEIPNLVLLDIMMPEMDGFEVVRRLKADGTTRGIPIVMVTALDDAGSRARLIAAGVDVMLTKPVDRWQLRSLLERTLAEDMEKRND